VQARIVALGPPVQANTEPASTYRHSVNVAALRGGGFVVVWESPTFMDFGRYFDASGQPVGSPFQLEGVFNLSQVFAVPAVVPNKDGGFVTTSNLHPGALLSAFGTDGKLRSARIVDAATDTFGGLALTRTSEDETALVWSDTHEFFAQRFDSELSPLRVSSVVIPFDDFANESGFSVASRPKGGLVIAWWDESLSEVWARLVSPQDEPEGEAFLVADGVDQGDLPSVCVGEDGSFVVAWRGRIRNMEFRRYDEQGIPLTDRLNSGLINAPTLLCLSQGSFVVSAGTIRAFDAGDRGLGRFSPGGSLASLTEREFVSVWPVCGNKECDIFNVFIQRLILEDGGDCVGDCNGDGEVAIDELVFAVNAALSDTGVENACDLITYCPLIDIDLNCEITIDEIIAGVGRALGGCE
jgi:hypothetical protein